MQERVARSWIGKALEDGLTGTPGVVHSVREHDGEIVLVARFRGEQQDRLISLSPRDDGEYLRPRARHARYAPLLRAS